jgi:uncharacterized protein (DUF1501 family)
MPKHIVSRREFLRMAGLASAGLSTAGSSLFQLKNLVKASVAAPSGKAGEYRALVCLFLSGGADSFNMVVPTNPVAYQEYVNSRSNLALPADQLLNILPNNIADTFGLHPSMAGIQNLFSQGNLAFINNIGTLVNPITKAQFENGNVPVPLGLLSHSDQTNQWQTGVANDRLIKGWAGRISDMMASVNTNSNISMNISLGGTNIFQSSNSSIEYTVNNEGATGLMGYGDMYGTGPARTLAVQKMFTRDYEDPFMESYKRTFKSSLDSSIEFQEAIDGVPEFATAFSNNYLSGQFRMIAKIIAAREALGFTRQIFFIDYGGWDNHDELLSNQQDLLFEVDAAITEFNNVLQEINMYDNVVTFSMSEFGRTLTSNGNGTDHAWGGNVFMCGGQVHGNNMFGNYPILSLDSSLDIGGGVLIPTTPNDLYFAELALWFGVDPSELTTILPNLGEFYSPGSTPPLGFLQL